MRILKPVDALTPDDCRAYPVWQFSLSHEHIDDTLVRPIKKLPVTHLDGRVVGTQVSLANGDRRWALVGNVDPGDPRLTPHFIQINVFAHGEWFTLARYHDWDVERNGPAALAKFLRLPIDDVFPIRYDIRHFCVGDLSALAATIEKEPLERLTRSEVIALAVPPPPKK